MKTLIAALVLSSIVTISAAAETEQPPTIIITPAPEVATPEAAAPSKMTPDECRKSFAQIVSLTKIVVASDKKAHNMRKGLAQLRDEGIVPELTTTPTWSTITQLMNAYAEITYQYSLLQEQRNKAFDTREEIITDVTTGCDYQPEGQS